jgi:hypothetical protein
MTQSSEPIYAFAPTSSRINALEDALRLVIAARKIGGVPQLLADAIDVAERVLEDGIAFSAADRRPVLNNTRAVQP